MDQANVGVLLQQVGGKAVPQRVWRHPLLDLGPMGGGMNSAVATGASSTAAADHGPETTTPSAAQCDTNRVGEFEQHGREHRKAILAPFALLDP